MRRPWAKLLAAACACGVMVALVGFWMGRMRLERVRQQPPVTLQEIERIFGEVAPESLPVQPAANAVAAGAAPTRLRDVASEEVRRRMFTDWRSRRGRFLARIGAGPLGSVAELGLFAVEGPVVASWARGEAFLALGNWDEARDYFSDVLRMADDGSVYREGVCGYLAWLEDDPELAARYAEIACSGEAAYPCVMALDLAVATGNRDLARHCLARGRSLGPEFDAELSRWARFATDDWLAGFSDVKQERQE